MSETNINRIDTVARQAQDAKGVVPEDIFPSTNIWMQALAPLIERPISPSLSITNNIGGAISLAAKSENTTHRIQRDRKGRSIPVRMALYLDRILVSRPDFGTLPQQFQVELLYLLCITIQLVSDQITSMNEEGPWKSLRQEEALSEADELVSSSRHFISTRVVAQSHDSNTGEPSVSDLLLDLMMTQSKELTTRGIYSSRALSELIQSLVESRGMTPALEERLLRTEILKASPETTLVAAAAVTGLGETAQPSKQAFNFCNRLVSDVAAASITDEKTLMKLVLLTLCGQMYEKGDLPVANNRIVFAVRQICSWFDEPENLNPAMRAEICRSLAQLLPCMKDTYGPYWEQTLDFCLAGWTKAVESPLDEVLPFIHASLRLVKTLETLEEPNDDLEDSLKEISETKSKALIELLKLPRGFTSQPLEIVDGMICREIEKLPTRHIPDLADIFPLVASESRDIQTAAFNLLHKAIPSQQEQKSVDVLLDKTGKYREFTFCMEMLADDLYRCSFA